MGNPFSPLLNLFSGGGPGWTMPSNRWKNPDTGMSYNIGPRSQGMLGGKATPQNPMNSYFTQMMDPGYRQAMQQQNLFSNLLNFGAKMKAAGAPTTAPGAKQRGQAEAWAGLGKGLMSGNQAYRNQMIDAIKMKSMMDTNKLNQLKLKNTLNRQKYFARLLNPVQAQKPQVTTPLTEADPVYAEEFEYGGSKEPVTPSALPTSPTTDQVSEQFNTVLEKQLGFALKPNDMERVRMAHAADPSGKQLQAVIGEIQEARQKETVRTDPRVYGKELIQLERGYSKDYETIVAPLKERIQGYAQLESLFMDPSQFAKLKMVNKTGKIPKIDMMSDDIFKDDRLTPSGKMTRRGAQDLALIFGFMKMLDPRSVVREGEFTAAANTGGAVSAWYAKAQGVLDGRLLTEKERAGLMQLAQSQFYAAQEGVQRNRETFMNQVKQYEGSGMDPERMFRFTRYEPKIPPGAFGIKKVSHTLTEM